MPLHLVPDLYIEEFSSEPKPIAASDTSTCAMVGAARKGPIATPVLITSVTEFERLFRQPHWLVLPPHHRYQTRHAKFSGTCSARFF